MVRGGLETRCGWVFAAERCGPINACDKGDGLGRGAGTVPGGLGEGVVGHLSMTAESGCVAVEGDR